MEDNYIFPNQGEPQKANAKNDSSFKVVIIGFLGLMIILLVGGAAFFVGKESGKSDSISSTSPDSSTLSYQAENLDTTSPTPKMIIITPTPDTSITPSGSSKKTPTPTKAKATSTPTPKIKTITLQSKDSLDGYLSSDGRIQSGSNIRAGRNTNLTTRGFVSFDLDTIPQGVTIFSATLRLYQAEGVGDPYGVGGNLKIDHLNYGGSLDESDFNIAPILTSFATLSSVPTVEWKEADVSNALKNDIFTQRSKSQYRIHFTNEEKGGVPTGDFVYFESSEDTYQSGFTPQLVVKYY